MQLTPRLMRNPIALFATALCMLCAVDSTSQSQEAMDDINLLLDDALFFSEKFLSPATDVAVYQASSNWVTTPQKRELWDVTASVHINAFFTPQRNREITISNSDFDFFTIEGATSAVVPTALGDDTQVFLNGEIRDGETVNAVRLKSPKGINAEVVVYPYIQASVGLLYGTELTVKYSPKVTLERGNYQVYGVGVKHNLSQYFKETEAKNIFFSTLVAYSKEDIGCKFLDTETSYGSLGLSQITGHIGNWQLQFNASKTFDRWEIMSGVIGNRSNIEYEVGGPKGEIESVLPVQFIINKKLEDIYTTKYSVLGEVAARYRISQRLFAQSAVAFGRFLNMNFSIQYQI